MLSLFCALFLFSPLSASALSKTWTENLGTDWAYHMFTYGWMRGLLKPTVNITYDVQVINADVGTVVPPNASIPVGTNLTLKFTPHTSEHIYWFGTGAGHDSPYGDWVVGATPPPETQACEDKDYVGDVPSDDPEYDAVEPYKVYIPFNVNPPVKTITDLDGLSCGELSTAGELNCTVTSPGNFTPVFNFSDTYGTFYYQYLGWSGSTKETKMGYYCHIQDADEGMRVDISIGDKYGSWSWGYRDSVGTNRVKVPTVKIPYPLTATETSSDKPMTPTVKTDAACLDYSFTLTSISPRGEDLRYGIDWNNNGTVDEWVPALGYVPSGTSQVVTRTWNTPGQKTFKVISEDAQGLASGAATVSVTVPEDDPCEPLGVQLNAAPSTINKDDTTTLEWSTTGDPDSCTASASPAHDVWNGSVSASGGLKGVKLSKTTWFTVTCEKGGKTVTDNAQVTVECTSDLVCIGGNTLHDNNDCVADIACSCSLTGVSCDGSGGASISVYPPRVKRGNTTQIHWITERAGICSIASVPADGKTYTVSGDQDKTVESGPINYETTYTLACTSADEAKATVKVLPSFDEI